MKVRAVSLARTGHRKNDEPEREMYVSRNQLQNAGNAREIKLPL